MSDETIKQDVPPPAPPPPPEPPLVKPDAISESEVAALVGILVKTVQLDEKLAANRKIVEEANKEIAADSLLRAKGVNALNLFGFDSSQTKVWTAVREVIGSEAYQRAVDIGKGRIAEKMADKIVDKVAVTASPPPPTIAMLAETLIASSAGQHVKAGINTLPKISDAILAFLRARGKVGSRASELGEHLRRDYGMDIHEKTPGMTLYRLSKEGLVRRENRLWFAVDESESEGTQDKTETSQ